MPARAAESLSPNASNMTSQYRSAAASALANATSKKPPLIENWRCQMNEDRRSSLRAVVVGAVIGHVSEWYDYLVYGYVAGAIATQFFPNHSSVTSILETFAVFAISFATRPIGGVIFGHFGDRLGRTKTLAATIGLIALSTVAIGLIPGYRSIGVWAPVLLVAARLLQGLSAGGELSGGTSVIVEYAPAARRGFFLGFLSVGLAIAAIMASGFTALVSANFSAAAYNTWAWRIPFWAAAPIGAIGLYIRLKLEETPAFRALQREQRTVRVPIVASLQTHWRMIAWLLPFFGANGVANYYLATFYPHFMVAHGSLSTAASSLANLAAFALMGIFAPIFGYMSDRAGRRSVRVISCLLVAVFAYPTIFLALSGSFGLAAFGLVLLGVANGALNVATYLALTELFRVETRYTSGAVSYNVAYAAFAGTAPLIGTVLADAGGSAAAAGYVVFFGVIGLIVAITLPETLRRRQAVQNTVTAETPTGS